MTSDNTSTILLHKPFGNEHPFEQQPCERFPRNPVADEPVSLGVTTSPGDSIEATWCVWQVEGYLPDFQAEGTLNAENETEKTWQIPMPAFPGGSKVRYRIFGKGVGGQLQTEWFSFSVSTWVSVERIISVQNNSEGLSAVLSTAKDDITIRMQIEPGDAGTFSFLFFPEETKKPIHAGDSNGSYELSDLIIEFQAEPFGLCITRKSDGMQLQTSRGLSALVSADGRILRYRAAFNSPKDEAFYGFGERYNALDQRGYCLENRVIEQYKNQGIRTYFPVPFFISSRGYGLWLKTERWAEFDLASREENTWSLDGEAEQNGEMRLVFLPQSQPHALMQAFTTLTGKPKLPPTWIFGLWMSANAWNNQKEVLHQLELTQRYNIPATVLVIEAWSDEVNFYIWNDAQYKIKPPSEAYNYADFTFPPESHWPDPKGMVDTLHKNGIRLVLWQIPVIKKLKPDEKLDATQNEADLAYAQENGFIVKQADGSPYQVIPLWFHGSAVIDFTNPQAVAWWLNKRKYLVTEMGVDGFKTDGGEHIWARDARFFDGKTGSDHINSYPLLYIGAYDRFMREHRGDDFTLFSRAGYTGLQQFPSQWAGDENSTWAAFRASIYAMLNAGLCGLPFIGWDIAGFTGAPPSAELYLRAAAMSVFCPIMQYHSEDNALRIPRHDRTPWHIQEISGDEDVIPLFSKFANIRMNLMPYLLSQAWLASQSGIPMMRALALEYPQDATCRKYPLEYCFGDALLVAPITEEGASTWPVYLPEGVWRDLWTGKIHYGPAEINIDAPRDRVPVYQKKGSLLALNLSGSGELGSYVGNKTEDFKNLTLRIFPGEKFESPIFLSADTEPVWVTVECQKTDGLLVVDLPILPQCVDLEIAGLEPLSVTHDGQSLPRLSAGGGTTAGWQWDSNRHEIRVHLPDNSHSSKIVIA